MASIYEIHFPITSATGGGGGSGQDRFAPKYLVGNVPNGDSAVPYAAGGFVYIPDLGDGAGISSALSSAAASRGDVWLRPGLYDLGAGATVAPLPVPSDVRVYGSGYTTIVRGRSTANQGIFTLGTGSHLRDMTLDVVASDAGSLGSSALVRATGPCVLDNLRISLVTHPDGALKEAIRFEALAPGFVFSDVQNIRVLVNSSTGPLSMSRGVYIEDASVSARHVEVNGGDEAVFVKGGIFVCKDAILTGWQFFGARHVGDGGALRLDEGLVQSANQSGGICVYLEGNGGHVLRSVSCQTNGGAGSIGIIATHPGFPKSYDRIQIDDCEVFNAEVGIQLGDADTYPDDCSIVNCSVLGASQYGIVFPNDRSSRCHIQGNTIETAIAVAGMALWLRGRRHEVDGNHINHQNPNVNSQAVLLECQRTTFRGNTIDFQDANGIVGIYERLTVVGNEITAQAQGTSTSISFKDQARHSTVGDNTIQQALFLNSNPAIRIDPDFCTIGDNSIEVWPNQPVAPAILLNGDNNTCIGNTVEGAPGFPVQNTGLGNEVAHNVGA